MLETIESLIKKKAEQRLTKDIREIADFASKNRLLKELEIAPYGSNRYETLERHLSWDDKDRIRIGLINKWLPTYISEESKSFIEKVDSIQDQLEDLRNGF